MRVLFNLAFSLGILFVLLLHTITGIVVPDKNLQIIIIEINECRLCYATWGVTQSAFNLARLIPVLTMNIKLLRW